MQKLTYLLTQNTTLALSQYTTPWNKTGRISCLSIQSELVHLCTLVCSDNIACFRSSLVSVLISFLWNHSKRILQILVQLDLKRTSLQKNIFW
jgi:hypothetical protein